MAPSSFTGRARKRKTSPMIRTMDLTAKTLITLGGIGTIVAVLLVCVYLAWVAIPLFTGSRITPAGSVQTDAHAAKQVHLVVDEYRLMSWGFFEDGSVEIRRVDNGHLLSRRELFSQRPVSWAFGNMTQHAVFGFADGSIRLGSIGFASGYLEPDKIPEAERQNSVGHVFEFEEGLVQRVGENQFRHQKLQIELQDPVTVAEGLAVSLIDVTIRPDGPVIAMLTADDKLRLKRISSRRNILTGKVTTTLSGGEIAVPLQENGAKPSHLLLSGIADTVYVVWPAGQVLRFDTRDLDNLQLAETVDLIPEPDRKLAALQFMIGKTTLMCGDSTGRIRTWFRIKPDPVGQTLDGQPLVDIAKLPDHLATPPLADRLQKPDPARLPPHLAARAQALRINQIPDGSLLAAAHDLAGPASPVVAMASSIRDRKIAAAYADGSIRIFHVTSNQELVREESLAAGKEPIRQLAFTPKDDSLIAASASSFHRWDLFIPHPETTFSAIFRPVWYEGYNAPEHVWQSSSGTDDFEPKYGLYPLVFGTIKATVYCMLFGVPLALLAAIYTSEFMHPRTKAKVKPTIELMASLPSVVLGFLAALFFAPLLENIVPEFLASFCTIPFALLTGAYLWQMLPEHLSLRIQKWRLPIMALCLPAGLILAAGLGPVIERLFFWIEVEGRPVASIRGWLAGNAGAGATGGWMFMMLPLSAILASMLVARGVTPILRQRAAVWSRQRVALMDFAKFLITCVVTVLVALTLSSLLAAIGWDPRGSFVGTFVQRNALVVGFVMGFAVIPIIYTIAEDALSSVPEHLRAASLGAGATTWQTAVRIVIPTAMSGLFSAIMIGFGRAVGETMIVLMAAGNTPVLEWNIFNGFRTLSANIAVELPEAVTRSTHYRMLFLAALALFLMTFFLNTIAETIRQRFRKRAFQL